MKKYCIKEGDNYWCSNSKLKYWSPYSKELEIFRFRFFAAWIVGDMRSNGIKANLYSITKKSKEQSKC